MTTSTDDGSGDSGVDAGTVGKSLVGFLIAGVVLYLFGRVVGWNEIAETLRGAELRWLALACASTTVCLVIWSKAWDVTLSAVDVEIPFRSIVVTYYAATFADYVTPFGKAGGGPFVAYVLSTDDRASFENALASVVVSDTLNLVPFFTFAGVGFVALGVTGNLPSNARLLVYGLAALLLVLPAVGYLLWTRQGLVERLVVGVLGPVSKLTDRVDAEGVRERVDELYVHLNTIADTGHAVAHTLAYAYVGWVFFAVPLYLAALTVGVEIDPLLVLFIVPASTLASFVPTPGGLGGVEAAITGLLVALAGLSLGTAASIALLYRVASYWYVVAVGGGAALVQLRRT
ncbi:lysylphosphatidylglycerol synthase transmembrane domain-containing protein [Candidatus Halobonum tyrrellensis]|uniref:Integral membrane protein n=1 Tax=Candidatus Halobonum tyrrellensis G22 TaxID=1324957 RepID=V4HG07_9EURY|nr:lysylphosphatidylglycerol synthase transmembrane domain-containing protein [Candidatus Halobonum tyrrellensis]ESP89650.1 hypothetical protein K933_02996 [Candidatus Halobonum tyrrellensis G22]